MKKRNDFATRFFLFLQAVIVMAAAGLVLLEVYSTLIRVPDVYITGDTRAISIVEEALTRDQEEVFEESQFFGDIYYDTLEKLMEYLSSQEMYRELSSGNANGQFDLLAYYDKWSIHDTQLDAGLIEEEEPILYSTRNILAWIEDGYESTSENATLSNGSVVKVSAKELYLPVGGLSLLERAKDYQQYLAYTSILKNVLEQASLVQDSAEYYEEIFGKKDYATNFRYLFVLSDGEREVTYDNLKEGFLDNATTKKDIEAAFMDESFYMIYQYSATDSSSRCSHNMIYGDEVYQELIKDYSSRYGNPEALRFTLYVTMDETYGYADAFQYAKTTYQTIQEYRGDLFLYAGGALVVALILFVLLTVAVRPHQDEQGRAFMKGFGKWITEIAVILFMAALVIGPIGLYGYYELLFSRWDPLSMDLDTYIYAVMIPSLFVIFIYVLTVMGLYLSIVKRIKANTFWRNTLLAHGYRLFARTILFVVNQGVHFVVLIIGYLLFLIINFITVVALVESQAVLVLFFVLPLDLVLGYLVIDSYQKRKRIIEGIQDICGGKFDHKINEKGLYGENLTLARAVNQIGITIKESVEKSIHDERQKTDLITNVSHDIKTPLTSIISYVDLIKRENQWNEKVVSYIQILDAKSQRLKQLTDDLVEASKISSGNMGVEWQTVNMVALMQQTIGEFDSKFEQCELRIVEKMPATPLLIQADSRHMYRIMENLFSNVCKYSLPQTRVYIELAEKNGFVRLCIKNISALELNVCPEELTERFIRGDESRTTEGSGLGLSIARNLVELQNGSFSISIDGDLFCVCIEFRSQPLE